MNTPTDIEDTKAPPGADNSLNAGGPLAWRSLHETVTARLRDLIELMTFLVGQDVAELRPVRQAQLRRLLPAPFFDLAGPRLLEQQQARLTRAVRDELGQVPGPCPARSTLAGQRRVC